MPYYPHSFLCNERGLISAMWLVFGLLVLQSIAAAQSIIVGQRSSDGRFHFETGEEVLINESRKVKVAPGGETTLDPSKSKSLERIEISRAGMLLGDGKGRLFRVNGASRERVLPENFVAKDAVSVAALQVPLIITVVRNRKSKDFVNIAPELLYVAVFGEETDVAVERFVSRPANFSNTDEQIDAMAAFAKSFSGTQGVKNLRQDLKARLDVARTDFDEGGPYQSLLDSAKIVHLSKQAFPADQELTGASSEIDNRIEATAAKVRLLEGLAGLRAWNSFLTAYRDVELHADSFPAVKSLHRRALEEKTRMSCIEAQALLLRNRQEDALERFATAARIDPNNPEIQKRMAAAQMGVRKEAPSGKPLPKDSSQASRGELEELTRKGEYTQLYAASTSALKLEPMNPELLYAAGVSASILRKPDEANGFLDSYLKYSDNLATDDESRIRVRRLQAIPRQDIAKQASMPEPAGTRNWFSGQKLSRGIYYCPVSLAFQVPVDSVSTYKFRMVYSWQRGRLTAIHTDFEDDKGREDYAALASAAARGKNDGRTDGNFAFVYDSSGPSVRGVRPGEKKPLAADTGNVQLLKNPDGSVRLVDADGAAEVVLRNDRLVDTEVVRQVIGPVTTVVSGNSFFNPFIWDGIHYFTITYDSQGRISIAKEWNADNVVHFSWDKQRLSNIAAYHAHASEPYYRRTISYSAEKITGEEYSTGEHSGRIKYVYAKDELTFAKVEDGGVHDGKTWLARMQVGP